MRLILHCLHFTLSDLKHDLELPSRNSWDLHFYSENLLIDGRRNPFRLPIRKINFTNFRKPGRENDFKYWTLCSGENHQVEKTLDSSKALQPCSM